MTTAMLKPAQPAALAAPTLEERAAFRTLEKSEAVHRKLIADLTCMNRVEARVEGPLQPLHFPLTVAAWNLERGLFVEASADRLADQRAGIVLLSEVDDGMARTGQRAVAQDIALRLGQGCAFGVEFLELGLGSKREQALCGDDATNDKGFHGNAVLAAAPLLAPAMIRLDAYGHWFNADTDQPRIGGRCAVIATVPVGGAAVVVVSVHLESRSDGDYRARQVEDLLACVDGYAGDLPVIIGGDLNTGNATGGDFEHEPLFAVAAAAGYDRHGGALDRMTLRSSRLSPEPPRAYKLDWFLTRGLAVGESRVVDAVGPDGTPLSDHEMIVVEIAGLAGETAAQQHDLVMPEAY